MKKLLTFLFLVIFLVLTFSTCSKDDVDVAYSKNTIEENKQNIEDEGLELIGKLDGMKDLGSLFAVRDLSNLLTGTPVGVVIVFKPVVDLLDPIAKMDKNPMGLVALRATSQETDDFFDFFGKEAGIYTWNSTQNDFVWSASPNELTFKYPTEGSSTNNATLKFSNLTSITTTNDSFSGEKLPTSLNVTLVSSGVTLLSLEFSGEYNSDDLPSKISTTLEFDEGYKFTQEFTNSTSKAAWNVSYSFDGDDIFAAHFESKGDFSYDNFTGDEDLSTQDQVDQFLNTANTWIQIGNLKLAGVIDYEGLYKEANAEFPEGEEYLTKAENTRMAEIFNKYLKLCLLYAKERQAIAKSSFYAYEYDAENWAGEYTTNLKFIFEDGSSMDESFFETGFEDFIDAYEEFLTEMETNYNPEQPI